MKAFRVYTSNRAHYATFKVTARDKDKAGERVMALIEEEAWADDEYYDQPDDSEFDFWPHEDFIYTIDRIEEAQHSTDLMLIDSGGNG